MGCIMLAVLGAGLGYVYYNNCKNDIRTDEI